MARKDPHKLTERISIRFTRKEIKILQAIADGQHERKVSSLLRRICLDYAEDKTEAPRRHMIEAPRRRGHPSKPPPPLAQIR